MRIAVVGAGIIGVTTAYELAADRHEVVVFERRGTVAAETSFANAGVIAPGYVTPWAAPGMPTKVLRHLLGRHAPVRVSAAGALTHAPWVWRWLRACRVGVYQAKRSHMHRLASYSSERLHALTQELGLEYERAQGYMVLLRSAQDLAQARSAMIMLRELDVKFDLLEPAQARSLEPGLSETTPLHAAIGLPHDEVANCRQFAHLLRAQAQRLGAKFHFHHDVLALTSGPKPMLRLRELAAHDDSSPAHWKMPAGQRNDAVAEQAFDAVVVCAGYQANALLRPLGLALPLAPVYGYSITAPLRHSDDPRVHGPLGAVMDERYKVAISRLGLRLRVAGSAELGGFADRMNPAAIATLYKVLDDWYPGAADIAKAQRWKGARPMLPDGPPVIGASASAGIWLNLGHGSSGWALSCGCARAIADLLAQRRPDIDLQGLQPQRLRR